MLFDTPEVLINQLDRLYQDRKLRLKIRARAYELAVNQRRIEDHIARRVEWYKSLHKNNPRPDSVDDETLVALEKQASRKMVIISFAREPSKIDFLNH